MPTVRVVPGSNVDPVIQEYIFREVWRVEPYAKFSQSLPIMLYGISVSILFVTEKTISSPRDTSVFEPEQNQSQNLNLAVVGVGWVETTMQSKPSTFAEKMSPPSESYPRELEHDEEESLSSLIIAPRLAH